ncbi:serine carboxypeptidase S28, partial [Teladorsagia circumcincta]
ADAAHQNGFSGREAYFRQKLDHFNSSSDATWMQRYFYNLRYYRPGGNAIFLMVGGAGKQIMEWVQFEEAPFVQWGKERGAPLFALEHRFYGKSHPTDNTSKENLRLLNSRQAIEDIAVFIRKMNEKYDFDDPKWILFGGWYAGSLALWARQKYPDLITGAVSSAAILEPRVDFWEAIQFTEDAYRSLNPKCADNIQIAFAQMIDMLGTELGREQLSIAFQLKPSLSNRTIKYEDIQLFALIQVYNFEMTVQYRSGIYKKEGGKTLSMQGVCGVMNDESADQLRSMAVINDLYTIQSKLLLDMTPYKPSSYDDVIKYLRQEIFDEEAYASADRAWLWQSCTEFGSFITTDGGINSIFGPLVSLRCEFSGRESTSKVADLPQAAQYDKQPNAPSTEMTPRQKNILQRVHLGRPPHGFLPEPDM